MQLPDNLWIEVWQQARPVPVRKQKRLFDDGKEAEKVRLKLILSLLIIHLISIDSTKIIIVNTR
jgi:hypothetical protein